MESPPAVARIRTAAETGTHLLFAVRMLLVLVLEDS
jgi:hypothetical protein